MRYRNKPKEVEAVRWSGDNLAEVQAFVGRMQNQDGDVDVPRFREDPVAWTTHDRAYLWVEANQAWVPVPKGQWILKDSAGFYPCRPDIFAMTYEPVSS